MPILCAWRGVRRRPQAYCRNAARHAPRARRGDPILFENLDSVLGRGISFEMYAMQDKLLRHQPRWLLLRTQLAVRGAPRAHRFRGGRADRPHPDGQRTATSRAHAAAVDAEGSPWLVDVGLGGQHLLKPISRVLGRRPGSTRWRSHKRNLRKHRRGSTAEREKGRMSNLRGFTVCLRHILISDVG